MTTQAPNALPVLTDRSKRQIRYLRVSVTDRCNFRCHYCMPEEGFKSLPREDLLSLDELVIFIRTMARMGVQRVRITGGEPLIRKGLPWLVEQIASTPGIEQVAMTTNGHLLGRYAEELWAAGLRQLNVSIDTFDADRFRQITRGGELNEVLQGIKAAEAVGFEGIKVNAVAIRDVNGGDFAAFTQRCWQEGWLPRFIELMPIGGDFFRAKDNQVPTEEILEALQSIGPLKAVGRGVGVRGPASYHVVTEGPFEGRKVGIISPMTDDGFCAACNRARLTARGGFRPCLADDHEVSILRVMRSGVDGATLEEAILAGVQGKRPEHRMRAQDTVPLSIMTGIGG